MLTGALLLTLVAVSATTAPLTLRKAASVLCVAVPERQVAAMLACGEGPRLPARARCPDCEGELRRWPGYSRLVRHRGRTRRLALHRARCRGCCRTHALLPSFLTAYRRDVVPTIGRALLGAARGRGHRRLAAEAGVPASTARGWLRRARRGGEPSRRTLVRFACELGVYPGRPSARGDPLAALLEQIAAVHRGAADRRLLEPEECPFGLAGVLAGGWLLGSPRAA